MPITGWFSAAGERLAPPSCGVKAGRWTPTYRLRAPQFGWGHRRASRPACVSAASSLIGYWAAVPGFPLWSLGWSGTCPVARGGPGLAPVAEWRAGRVSFPVAALARRVSIAPGWAAEPLAMDPAEPGLAAAGVPALPRSAVHRLRGFRPESYLLLS